MTPPVASSRPHPDGVSALQATEDEFVSRLRRGDAGAFRQLVDRYADDLFRLACAAVGNEADGYDVVQETLAGAYQRLPAFDGRSSLRTWLLRILFNQASKSRRSKRVRVASPLYAVDGTAAQGGMDPGLVQCSSAEAVDTRLDLLAMLQTLSEPHRQVLVLREIQGLGYDEIAAVLGVPRGTVESRLFRARADLQRRFPDYLS